MNTQNSAINTLERTPAADSVSFTGGASKLQLDFIDKFLKGKDKTFERVLTTFDFARYEDYGIPLKYSRRRFVREVNAALENLPDKKQNEILNKFGLYRGQKDLEGVVRIPQEDENSTVFKTVKECAGRLLNNETDTRRHGLKTVMDTVLKGFPEFTSIIGKKQHGTHIYSVDIHSLKLLQSSMNNPAYKNLSDEGKEVLKFTALLHDFGKQGGVITPGHAAQSKVYAEAILKNFPIKNELKERILTQVENHHWFEGYNRNIISESDVREIFKTKEDLQIAKIMAKADFENVNPEFHLMRMVSGKEISQQEFDKLFAKKVSHI